MGNFIRVIIICTISLFFPPFFLMILFLPNKEEISDKNLTRDYMKSIIANNKRK